MNDAPILDLGVLKPLALKPAEAPAPRKACCANCSAMVMESKDYTCHDASPQVTVVMMPAPPPRVGQMMVQNFCSFPSVRPDQWCRRHAFGSSSGDARRAAAPAMLSAEGGE